MKIDDLEEVNTRLSAMSPAEIIGWALDQGAGRTVVSTNFRPYEAVLLHLVVEAQPDIPVLWVDHGFNRPATYRHADELTSRLQLNLHAYHPRISAAHYEAVHGGLPASGDEVGLQKFSALMKLEPFKRGMRDLAPRIWLTALRKVQNPNRAELDIVSHDANFGALKVSPLFHWTDDQMENYLKAHDLANEWDYFDPAKADEKRECGLHAEWGGDAVNTSDQNR